MLSRLRKFLHLESCNSNRGDTTADKQMPFITGSQPWLKPYILAALAHPPNPPSLNAHYLQAVSPVSSRREITVYDGHFIIPAVLSQSAAALLDADEDDTGVTTRNLLGHVLAPVSVVVVPDMKTTPPTATLLIKEVRVFADRVHQRPVGRVPLVYTDPEVCDALRAIVGRQLASYATATVLERADRAAQIQIDDPPETDTFFERLLHDPGIPQSRFANESDNFAMQTRRGTVVGGGAMGDDDHEALVIVPENPTPPQPDQSQKPEENATPADSQSNQRDPDWDISFTQDPAEGGGDQNVASDVLPQTQHFAIDDDDDDDEDEDNDDKDDEVDKGGNDDASPSVADRRKSDGEQRIKDIVGNAQENTLDEEQISAATKRRGQGGEQMPVNESIDANNSTVTPLQSTSKDGGGNTGDEIRKNDSTSQRRTRSMKTPSESAKEKEENVTSPVLPSNRSVRSRKTADNHRTDKELQSRSRTRSQSSKAHHGDAKGVEDKSRDSPSRVTRSGARNASVRSPQPKGNYGKGTEQSRGDKGGRPDTALVSPRRSPRIVEMKTPPRRRRSSQDPEREAGEEEGQVTPRRSPRLVGMKTPPQKERGTDESEQALSAEEGAASPRRSPRVVEMKTPPRRLRRIEEPEWKPSEDEPMADGSPRTPLRRSPRVQQQNSPLTRSQARRSARLGSFTLGQPNYKEDEEEKSEEEEDGDYTGAEAEEGDDHPGAPKAAVETGSDKKTDAEEGQLKTEDEQKRDSQSEVQPRGKSGPSAEVEMPEAVDPVGTQRVERGTKRKALEISSPGEMGPNKRREEEEKEPSSFSPEPFLDKINAEIEEMKRFRDRIDRDPDGYKTYPDGFLPSAKPAKLRVQRILKFPPPSQQDKRVLDVPESAPM